MRPPLLMPTPAATRALLAVLAMGLWGTGCAGSAPARQSAPVTGARPAVAFLPLEDLSGQTGAADRLSRIVFTALAQQGACMLADPGAVDAALTDARVRSTGRLTPEQGQAIARQLAVRWLITGSALEYTRVRSPDGDLPAVGIALRVIDPGSGRVVWADQRFRSGEDHETFFGWGRESDLDRLAQAAATDLVRAVRFPAARDTAAMTKEKP